MAIEWATERRKVADLRDYPKNPRIFTEKGMADLKASLKSLGYIDPIAVNLDGTIIGGHARKAVLRELGLNEVDVRVPSRQLTEKEVEEAIIRLNRNTAGEWDFKMLEEAFDRDELLDWGFQKADFNAFAQQTLFEDIDAVEEEPETAISSLGDIWQLGDHRLLCGSATDSHAVKEFLAGGGHPNLMVTDPPYGVNYDPAWRDRASINRPGQKRATGKVTNDHEADWTDAWALFPGDVAYVWHNGLLGHLVAANLLTAGFELKSQIIWAKPMLVIGRGNYHWQHEPCWYAVRAGAKHNYVGDRKQTTLWAIENMHATSGNVDDGKTNHSTQKPVECMKRPIVNNSVAGDTVYDPFCGSGTTVIACEVTKRKCAAIELNPIYVDMIVRRWQKFTGKQAVHAATGKPFPDNAQKTLPDPSLSTTTKKAKA